MNKWKIFIRYAPIFVFGFVCLEFIALGQYTTAWFALTTTWFAFLASQVNKQATKESEQGER